jgi:hypothetical protein
MPKWVHDRAEHLLAKNPSMSKSMAFAIATQQGEAGGHTPKGFGTSKGKHEAKAKYSTPKDDERRANPGHLDSPKLAAVGQVALEVLKATGLLAKLGFATSQYAGTPAQNAPGMKGQSQIPAFAPPPIEHKDTFGEKAAGMGVGAGTTTSQYSGPLSYGGFKQTSQVPAYTAPAMTKYDPSLEAAPSATGGAKTAASMAATGAMGAAGKLRTAQRVGAPKLTGFSGPSISQIAKPKGFGTPLSGATKGPL